jgi:hypothetical protein
MLLVEHAHLVSVVRSVESGGCEHRPQSLWGPHLVGCSSLTSLVAAALPLPLSPRALAQFETVNVSSNVRALVHVVAYFFEALESRLVLALATRVNCVQWLLLLALFVFVVIWRLAPAILLTSDGVCVIVYVQFSSVGAGTFFWGGVFSSFWDRVWAE